VVSVGAKTFYIGLHSRSYISEKRAEEGFGTVQPNPKRGREDRNLEKGYHESTESPEAHSLETAVC